MYFREWDLCGTVELITPNRSAQSRGESKAAMSQRLDDMLSQFDKWASHVDDQFDHYDDQLTELQPTIDKLAATTQVCLILVCFTQLNIHNSTLTDGLCR